MNHKTLPAWLSLWNLGASLEVVRKIVRREAALRALGVLAGPVRLYDEREAETIRAALEAHQKKNNRRFAVTA